MSNILFEHIFKQLKPSIIEKIELKIEKINSLKTLISDVIDSDFYDLKYDKYFSIFFEKIHDGPINIIFEKSYDEYLSLSLCFSNIVNDKISIDFYFSKNLTTEYYNSDYDLNFCYLYNNKPIGWNRINSDLNFQHTMHYVPDYVLDFIICNLKNKISKNEYLDLLLLEKDFIPDHALLDSFFNAIFNTKSLPINKNLSNKFKIENSFGNKTYNKTLRKPY